MKQNCFKRLISLLTTLAVLCTMVPVVFAAETSGFVDFPQGWSKEAMTFAVNNGLINGKTTTTIEPGSNLTRAEMAAIINRAFGAEVADDISSYTDVSSDAWYYNDIGKAVHMETFQGDGNGKMRPDAFITREEVMAVLARALVLEYDDFSPINTFGDYSSVSEWARPYLAALIGEGYVDGYEDKTLRPLNNITREEFVQLMYNIFKTYLTVSGNSYDKVDDNDCVMINQPDITLSDVTIEGDLVLGDGVGSGRIYLNNVKIKGRLLARGGFITLTNVTTGGGVVVKNVNGRTHFFNWRTDKVFDGVRELTYTTYLTSSNVPGVGGTTGGGGSGGGGGGGGSSSSKKAEYTISYYFQSSEDLTKYVIDNTRTVTGSAKVDTVKTADIPTIENYAYNSTLSIPELKLKSGKNELKIYYDLNKYNVSYTKPDGTEDDAQIAHGQKAGDVIDMPDTYTDDDGNEFDVEWHFKDGEGNDEVITPDYPVKEPGTIVPVLYAKVIFDYNYPGAERTEIVVEKDKTLAQEFPAAPSREGYTFEGWNTNPGGTGTTYTADTVISTPVTVYAVWKSTSPAPVYHTVTFSYNYAGSPDDYYAQYTNVLDGSKIAKPGDPLRDDYNFVGWYKDAAGTEAFDFDNEYITSNTILYAKWVQKPPMPSVFTVSFSTGEGSAVAPKQVTEGDKLTEPTAPTRVGYTFKGWFTDSDCTNEYDFDTPVTKNFTLYAKWEINKYTVTFDTNGGSSVSNQIVEYGAKASKPNAPTKDGYLFAGWYTDSTFTTIYDFNTLVTGAITIYAKWEEIIPNTYEVVFETDGGTAIPSQFVIEGTSAVKPTVNPQKEGHTFAGWYTDTTFTVEYNFNTPILKETTIFAKWNVNVYRVTFNSLGGSSVESQDVDYGSVATVPKAPTKDGFDFVGWYTDESCTTAYDFSTPISGNITLYAKWTEKKPDEFIVTFETYGGTVSGKPIDSQIVVDGDTVVRPADPVKEGHDFEGWYTDDAFAEKFSFRTPITQNTTIYAKWKAHTFEVTFESFGGSDVAPQVVEYGKTLTRPEDPTKSGYTFVGWYLDRYLTEPYDFNSPVTFEFTLYAEWVIVVPNKYVVTFVNEGSTSIPAQTINEGEKVTKPSNPKRTGYTFGGWFTDSEFENEYDFNTPVTSSFTLYGKWNINQYSVVFNTLGGSDVATQIVPYMGTVTEPEIPTRDGYNFIGWYSNRACTLLYDFSAPVTKGFTLYAKWEVRIPERYVVNFKTNGGTSVSSQTVREDEKVVRPVDPSREGYTFGGWYTDSSLTNEYDFDLPVTSSFTLYAKWNINSYTVTFISNGGTAVSPQTVAYRSYAKEPVAPSREGYTFIGWYRDSGLSVPFNFAWTAIVGDTTLYAKWELNKYTVSFETFEGTPVDSQTVNHGSKVSEPSAPEKTGHTFKGWFANEECTVAFDFASAITSDTTIYAKWEINKYTVSFDSVGGTAVAQQIVNYGDLAEAPSNPEREGFIFTGWYTDETCTTLYGFGTPVTGNITLYAGWNEIKLTVSFDTNGGSAIADQTVVYGKTAAKPATPSKKGHIFDGWYTDEQLSKLYDFATAVKSDITLYAKWTKETYTISMIYGTETITKNVQYGDKLSRPEDPAKEGYTFDGWYIDSECTVKYDFDSAVGSNFSLYGKWVANSYKVVFEANNGTTPAEQVVEYGKTATKPADPTKEDFVFDGWYADSELTREYDFASPIVGNITIYAKWKEIARYTVTFDTDGGTAIDSQTVKDGEKATKPADPEKAGFVFGGWYADKECSNEYNFDSIVTANITIYAKWIEQTEKFDVMFFYGVDEANGYIGTISDVAAGSVIADSDVELLYADEGVIFADEGLEGYTDAETGYTHMIYPELRYLDGEGNWQVFDETTSVVSDMKVYYTFKYIQLMIDGNLLGIELDNISLYTYYESDTRFMDTLKDAMTLSRNPINNGLKGKESEIIKKISDTTGLVDTEGYVVVKSFGLHIAEIIALDNIRGEITAYLRGHLGGTDEEIRDILDIAVLSDVIDYIGAENLSGTTVEDVVQYIKKLKAEDAINSTDKHGELARGIVDIISGYGYYIDFVDAFVNKEATYPVNSHTIILAKTVANAVHDFSEDEIIVLLRDKGYGAFISLYGEAKFGEIFAQAQKEYYDGVVALEAQFNSNPSLDTSYTTKLNVSLNFGEILNNVYNKVKTKLINKLEAKSPTYYTQNKYLVEFVEQDLIDALFDYDASKVSKTNSGYKIKPIIEYYDLALENLILFDKALLWYGDLSDEELDAIRTEYAADMVSMYATLNEMLTSTQDGTPVVGGYTIDGIASKLNSVVSMIDKMGEGTLGGLEADIKLMIGDINKDLERLAATGETPIGFTVDELMAINNKLSVAADALGNKDYDTADEYMADVTATVLNKIVEIAKEIDTNGTINGEDFNERISHIPFINRFSSKVSNLISKMANGSFAKEYTKKEILNTMDTERIGRIIIGLDTDDRYTIDDAVDFIVKYYEDNKVTDPAHSPDEIVIDQYEKADADSGLTMRRYLY